MRQWGYIHISKNNGDWRVNTKLHNYRYEIERYFDTKEEAFNYARTIYEGITKCQ